MKTRFFFSWVSVIIFFSTCLFAFQAYARQVTCPRCGGKGVIPGPAIHGLQSVYGCPDCGGSGGGGAPGSPGRGWIEVPDEPQANPQGNQPDDTEAARPAAEAERQRAVEEQRQKQAEADARRQAEFEKIKQEALSSMKGIAENEFGLKGISTSDDSGLKGVGEPKASGLGLKGVGGSGPARGGTSQMTDQISNPQIARIMRGLQAIQVPPPLSHNDVSLSWKSLPLGGDSSEAMLKVADYTMLAWDLAGKVGQKALLPSCKVLLIAGKVFIAGEDGAYVHLVKQDQVYEDALHYLKNPATTKEFAELVRDLKEYGRPPASAKPEMVRAARAILDPSLGSSGTRIAWDSMLSPEARAAMVRKTCLEVGAELVGTGAEGLTGELTKRKELCKTALFERDEARRMLKATTNPLDQAQLRKVIADANHVLENIYRLEEAGPKLVGNLESIYAGDEVEKLSTKPDSQEK